MGVTCTFRVATTTGFTRTIPMFPVDFSVESSFSKTPEDEVVLV